MPALQSLLPHFANSTQRYCSCRYFPSLVCATLVPWRFWRWLPRPLVTANQVSLTLVCRHGTSPCWPYLGLTYHQLDQTKSAPLNLFQTINAQRGWQCLAVKLDIDERTIPIIYPNRARIVKYHQHRRSISRPHTVTKFYKTLNFEVFRKTLKSKVLYHCCMGSNRTDPGNPVSKQLIHIFPWQPRISARNFFTIPLHQAVPIWS